MDVRQLSTSANGLVPGNTKSVRCYPPHSAPGGDDREQGCAQVTGGGTGVAAQLSRLGLACKSRLTIAHQTRAQLYKGLVGAIDQ